MDPRYQAWIAAHVPTDAAAYGRCIEVTQAMVAAFPELRTVYGNYYCPHWGERWHQWCVAPDGTIVDPTARQFPSQGQGAYVEVAETALPAGRCTNCGEVYFTYYDGTVCSEQCGKEFRASLLEG